LLFFFNCQQRPEAIGFSVRQSGRSPPALSGPEPALRTWRDECQLSRFLMAFEKVERTKKYVRHFFYFFLVVVVFFFQRMFIQEHPTGRVNGQSR
jgi:hypothetical protein